MADIFVKSHSQSNWHRDLKKTYIIVYYENYFGIFDIKEYTELITSEQVFTPP